MNERQQAVADLRRIADNRIVTDSVAMNLEFIADLLGEHDERVIDLLTYNNAMLDENREQRRIIREQQKTIDSLKDWVSRRIHEDRVAELAA